MATDSKVRALAGKELFDNVLLALQHVAAAEDVSDSDEALLNMAMAINHITVAARKYAGVTTTPSRARSATTSSAASVGR